MVTGKGERRKQKGEIIKGKGERLKGEPNTLNTKKEQSETLNWSKAKH